MGQDAKLYLRRGKSSGMLVANETGTWAGTNSLLIDTYPNGVARNGMYLVAKIPAAPVVDVAQTATITLVDADESFAGSGVPGASAAQYEGVTLKQVGMNAATPGFAGQPPLVAKFNRSRRYLGVNIALNNAGVAAAQTIHASAALTGGTFTITDPQTARTTAALAYNISLANLNAALIAAGIVEYVATGGILTAPTDFVLTAPAAYAGPRLALTVASTAVTGGVITVAGTTGSGGNFGNVAIYVTNEMPQYQ